MCFIFIPMIFFARGGSWSADYPVHKAAYEGDVKALKDLLKGGHSAKERDDDGFHPIHYAAW